MDVKTMLQSVENGTLSVEDALVQLKEAPFTDLGFAKVDHHRAIRQGAAEVVYGAGKTPEQIEAIVQSLQEGGATCVLVTRLTPEAALLLDATDEIELTYYPDARIGIAGDLPKPDGNGTIVVACAGTSDLPVAEEAALTAEALGNKVTRLYDVGVAGLHRVLSHMDELVKAQVVIAIAGMEGALASVIGGLTAAPVIAVPTSVGYGAAFGGVAALLGMLTSCASGVSVVNIDNGFGAAFQAHQINHLRLPAQDVPGGEAPAGTAAPASGAPEDHAHTHTHGAVSEAARPVITVHAVQAARPAEASTHISTEPVPAGAITLDLSQSATRGTLLDQLYGLMDARQHARFHSITDAALVPARHHHDIAEVRATIDSLDVPEEVRADLGAVYAILAQAEATVHGTSVEQTHFHEVGNGSGISNALAICAAFYVLGASKFDALGNPAKPASPVASTPVQTGCGQIECAHGLMDVPAPATAAILETHHVPVQPDCRPGELCTPTSAALIAHFVDRWV